MKKGKRTLQFAIKKTGTRAYRKNVSASTLSGFDSVNWINTPAKRVNASQKGGIDARRL